MVSDDTEHTCLVAQALCAAPTDADRFARHLARGLRWWLLGLPAGIGSATLRATLKLWLGFPPARSGVFSAGNGPAMRSAILGAAMDDLELDAIIAPTATIPGDALSHGGFGSSSNAPALAGYPSITLPIGLWNGLPGGLHIFGRAYSEDVLLGIAYAIEQKIQGRTPPTYINVED